MVYTEQLAYTRNLFGIMSVRTLLVFCFVSVDAVCPSKQILVFSGRFFG